MSWPHYGWSEGMPPGEPELSYDYDQHENSTGELGQHDDDSNVTTEQWPPSVSYPSLPSLDAYGRRVLWIGDDAIICVNNGTNNVLPALSAEDEDLAQQLQQVHMSEPITDSHNTALHASPVRGTSDAGILFGPTAETRDCETCSGSASFCDSLPPDHTPQSFYQPQAMGPGPNNYPIYNEHGDDYPVCEAISYYKKDVPKGRGRRISSDDDHPRSRHRSPSSVLSRSSRYSSRRRHNQSGSDNEPFSFETYNEDEALAKAIRDSLLDQQRGAARGRRTSRSASAYRHHAPDDTFPQVLGSKGTGKHSGSKEEHKRTRGHWRPISHRSKQHRSRKRSPTTPRRRDVGVISEETATGDVFMSGALDADVNNPY